MTEPPVQARAKAADAAREDPTEENSAHRAARHWVHTFARTLKTCRLYESSDNPTVAKFLEDLTASARQFTREHGALALRFSSDDVVYDGVSLYFARSRDDNLALPFYRDGVRGLTINDDVTQGEIERLIAAIVHVTSPVQTDDDLVTLLWEAHLDHVDIDYVPAEGDVNGGIEAEEGDAVPWPDGEEESPADPAAEAGAASPSSGRSDDWAIQERTAEVEAGFAELESLAEAEVRRFRREYAAEHQVPVTTTAIAILQTCLNSGIVFEDPADLGRFLPRVLREALAQGAWLEAAEAVAMLDRHAAAQWSQETFHQELMQPISVSNLTSRLDGQEVEALLDFLDFAERLGDPGLDLMIGVLGQSTVRRNRRMLSEAVVARCRENPERLAPFLADPRWHVVRNVVHMLGSIGGEATLGLLESVVHHPEPRVRHAVISALSQVEPRSARPLLIALLADPDAHAFCTALRVVARGRDPVLARKLLEIVLRPEFENRTEDERHAIYQALGVVAGDEAVPEIEAELHRGQWFSGQREDHRRELARCLARIGSREALQALRRGSQSRRASVKLACDEALLRREPA